MSQHNTMIPAVSEAAYDAARRRAAFLDRSNRGRIVLSGSERASYLQGLFTNDIVALKKGEGCYTAYLTAQGRMIADLYVYELGDVMMLSMVGAAKDTVMARLDQFIFSEDVQLGDVTGTFAQVAVVGPAAADVVATIVAGISGEALRGMPEHGNTRVDWQGGTAIVTRVIDTGEPGFDLYVEREQLDTLEVGAPRRGRGGARRSDRRGRARGIRSAAVRPRHGRRDDSARGWNRIARDQLHERLLRRPGGDHPRAPSRTWPRRAQAGGLGVRR